MLFNYSCTIDYYSHSLVNLNVHLYKTGLWGKTMVLLFEVIETFGIVAIIGALATYLVKSLAKQILATDLEITKAELQRSLQKRIIVFSTLHEQRAKILNELHVRLNKIETFTNDYIAGIEANNPPKELASAILEGCKDLYIYFNDHRLYLPKSVVSQIETLLTSVGNLVNKTESLSIVTRSPLISTGDDSPIPANIAFKLALLENPSDQLRLASQNGEEFQTVRTYIEQVVQEIEKEFRFLLGSVEETE